MTDGCAGNGKLVLFDFDGVLVRGDSFASWLRNQLMSNPVRRIAAYLVAPLGLLLMAFPATMSIGVRLFLRVAVFAADAARLRGSIEHHAHLLAADPKRWIGDGLAALREHLAAGDRVVVVSGSEQTMVRMMLNDVGIANVEIVASQLAFGGSRVKVIRHCHGNGKVQALQQVGIDHISAVAYSDSPSDLPLLAGADAACCVNWPYRHRALAVAALGSRARFLDWR